MQMLHGAQKNQYIVPLLWWGGAAGMTSIFTVRAFLGEESNRRNRDQGCFPAGSINSVLL